MAPWFTSLLSRSAPVRAVRRVPSLSGSQLVLAVVLLTSAALAVIGITNALRTRENAIEKAEIATQNTARLFEQQISHVLDVVSMLLRMAAAPEASANAIGRQWRTAQNRPDQAAIEQQLFAAARDLPYIRAVRVIDAASGIALIDTTPGAIFRGPISPKADAEAVLDQLVVDDGKVHIGRPFAGASDRDFTVAISRKVAVPGRTAPLVAIVHLDLGYLQSQFDGVDLGSRGAMAISRANGILLARKPFDAGLVGQDVTQAPVFAAIRTSGPSGTLISSATLDGATRIISYRALQDFPLVVSAALEMSQVLGDWHAGLIRQGGLVVSAMFVVALLGMSLAREIRRREGEAETTRNNAAFLRSVFDSSSDCIEVVDLDGRVEFINASGRAAFAEHGVADLCGGQLVDLFPASAQADVKAALDTARGGGHARFTVSRVDADDMSRWWDVSITAVEMAGHIERIVAVSRDMSERMRTEEALRAAKRTAEAATEAKSEFLAAMSHELRTPLNGIINVTDMLMKTPRDRREHDLLSVQRDAGRQLLGIISNVLDWARIEEGRLDLADDPLDLHDTVRTCTGLLEPSAKAKGLTLNALFAADVPASMYGDRLRLQQIILNYLANAVKFTESGGVSLSMTCRGQRLHVAVSDTGPGIPETKQHLLFQKFSQVEQAGRLVREGSGLGLAITKRIVDALGGDVGVYSALGVGSTFWFEVPLRPADTMIREAPVEAPAVPARTDERTDKRTIRILLAEDVVINQIVVRMILEDEGFEVDVVGDGQAALAAVQTGAYDIVLLDVEMPKMSGLDAARAIRAQPDPLGRIPLIALTANAFPDQLANYTDSGMDACITKPVDRAHLVESVHRWTRIPKGNLALTEAEMSGPSLFNASIFQDLQSRIGAPKMDALIEIFTRTMEEGFAALDRAEAGARGACLHQVTHMLVSTAGTLGFDRLSAESRAIMEGRRTGEFADLVVDLRTLAGHSLVAWQVAARGREPGKRSHSLTAA